jgi:hypothetical protein
MAGLAALLPFLFIVLVLGLVIFLVVYRQQKEKERTGQLQLVAAQLGWDFLADAALNMIPSLDRFTLFNQGHGKQIRNMMYGEASGVKAAVFDYIYVTGYGKNRQTHYQSVVYLEPPNLAVPYFSLRPENLLLKVFSVFGYQDIDFGQRPEFSRLYTLRGQDESSIRQTFTDGLLGIYENYPGTCTDAGGNQLFLFRGGYRLSPQEIQSYVGLGLNVLNLLPRY